MDLLVAGHGSSVQLYLGTCISGTSSSAGVLPVPYSPSVLPAVRYEYTVRYAVDLATSSDRTGTRILATVEIWWLDLDLGPPKGHWKNSLKIGHVTNTYIGGMYAFTMNSHDPKGLMRL